MAVGTRRIARETAVQFLYQEDFTAGIGGFGCDLAERLPLFCALFKINKKARKYTEELLSGICPHLAEIDQKIEASAKNWRLARLAATDRNIMRVAVYEIVYREDIPGQVSINEAVEIAKKYASEDSPKFINGVLDSILTSLSVKS
ncbi:MAG: transcription antitermination factor NusB [Desulforhopalus sp.]|nr:transcription antitermination factor NusB [Desulforhopalus sp.]